MFRGVGVWGRNARSRRQKPRIAGGLILGRLENGRRQKRGGVRTRVGPFGTMRCTLGDSEGQRTYCSSDVNNPDTEDR